MVHQHPARSMRYFRWGVARLLLEAQPPPEVVPIFLEGTDAVMPEDRRFPRFLPRVGGRIRIAFGEAIDYEATFGDLRRRWESLVRKTRGSGAAPVAGDEGELVDDELRYGDEAQRIRIEVTRRMRDEILKLRRKLGYPDEEDGSYALAETWAKDPHQKRYRSPVDGSLVNQD